MKKMKRFWRQLRALTAASAIGLVPAARGVVAQDADDVAWSLAQSRGTTEAFQQYLDQFPIGRYADRAFAGIVMQARGLDTGALSAAAPDVVPQPVVVPDEAVPPAAIGGAAAVGLY